MLSLLEKLRKKPIEYKRRLAAIATVGVTAAIFTVWVSTINSNLDSIQSDNAVEAIKDNGPFSKIEESVATAYEKVTGSIKELKASLGVQTIYNATGSPAEKISE